MDRLRGADGDGARARHLPAVRAADDWPAQRCPGLVPGGQQV